MVTTDTSRGAITVTRTAVDRKRLPLVPIRTAIAAF
jgi:hypothetical protein